MDISTYTPEQQQAILLLTAKMITLNCKCDFTRLVKGPRITQYFFKPSLATPLSRILSSEEDLALATGANSLLIKRVRNEVSIALPNLDEVIIKFDGLLADYLQRSYNGTYYLPLLMGKTEVGDNLILDLSKQPHMLIAGSTGAGKSIFLTQLIATLAVRFSPKQLKLILVDTKKLDLSLFSELPHTVEFISEVAKLHPVLERLLQIVRQRTEQMKGIARNIIEYNALLHEKAKLPYYILIIDELADVISQDKELGKNETKGEKRTRIEKLLGELAQISRAVGIHIIAATQRPSIKILGGDIKANFPTRISFKLPTGFDSRVILDENGAEYLLGKGDYLYKANGDTEIQRAHSSFVDMTDIARILEQHKEIRETFAPEKG